MNQVFVAKAFRKKRSYILLAGALVVSAQVYIASLPGATHMLSAGIGYAIPPIEQTQAAELANAPEPVALVINIKSPDLYPGAHPQSYDTTLQTDERPVADPMQERLRQLKRRREYTYLVKRWDLYALQNRMDLALRSYLTAYRRLRLDYVLARKIGHIYALRKEYANAYSYLRVVPLEDLNAELQSIRVQSLMLQEVIDPVPQVQTLPDSMVDKPYLLIGATCLKWGDLCTTALQNNQWSTHPRIQTKIRILEEHHLISEDVQYRNALLMNSFLQDGQFRIAFVLAQEILKVRPDYWPVVKAAGVSAYELRRYADAIVYLSRSYEADPKDARLAYLIGMSFSNQGDPLNSNLFLSRAVSGGFEPNILIERQLVYNNSLMEDWKNALKVGKHLAADDGATIDDYLVVSYIAFREKDYKNAIEWLSKWIAKYPRQDMMLALRGSAYRMMRNRDAWRSDTRQAIALNPRNPVAMLNQGIGLMIDARYEEALQSLAVVMEQDKNGIFAKEAEEYGPTIRAALSASKQTEISSSASGGNSAGNQGESVNVQGEVSLAQDNSSYQNQSDARNAIQ
jgi:tetratricopeptide (TPR) repeat protein